MTIPVCRTVEEAYQAGIRDALANPEAGPELAERIVASLSPWLDALAAARGPRLLTVAQAAEQLAMSPPKVYELVYKGELPSVEIPSGSASRSTRRVEQSAVDAFIDRHRVTYPTTAGGVPPAGGRL